jgi:uncharacterized damage-inducible protein DinB
VKVPGAEFLNHYRSMARAYAIWNQSRWQALNESGSPSDAPADRIHRTLDHMLAADELWLARFNGEDRGIETLQAKSQAEGSEGLWLQRMILDQAIMSILAAYTVPDLLNVVHYRDFRGCGRDDVLGIAWLGCSAIRRIINSG